MSQKITRVGGLAQLFNLKLFAQHDCCDVIYIWAFAMKVLFRTAAAMSILALAACAQADPGDVSKAEVEQIIRSYLLENPEIIREALIELEKKSAQEEIQETTDAIAELSDQIFRDPRDYSIGPKDAKVQIVEFFDYNCGFCKRSTRVGARCMPNA